MQPFIESVATFRRLFAYGDWANRQTLDALRRATDPPPRAVQVMAHLVGAEQLWLHRLGQARDVAPMPIWPDGSADACAPHLDRLARTWGAYFDGIDDAALQRGVSYTNSRGEDWTNRVGDILTHVVVHGGHHRGQIALELRRAGYEPAYTDFIHAVRQGFLD